MSYILKYNGKEYTNLLKVNSIQTIFSYYNTADVTLSADISLLSTFKKGEKCKLYLSNGNSDETIVDGIITELFIDTTSKCRLIIRNKAYLLTKVTPNKSTEWGEATTKLILQNLCDQIGVTVSGLTGYTHKNASASVDEMCNDVAEQYVKYAGLIAISNEAGELQLCSPAGNKSNKVYNQSNILYALRHELVNAAGIRGYVGRTVDNEPQLASYGKSVFESYQLNGNPSLQESNAFLKLSLFGYNCSDYLKVMTGSYDSAKLLDIVTVKDILGISKKMLVASISHELSKEQAIRNIELVGLYD